MSNLLKSPEAIDWIYDKKMTKTQVFKAEANRNMLMTIALRIGFIIFLSIGIYCVCDPIVTLASFVSFVGDILGFTILLASFILGTLIGVVVIALAWLFYRPLLGVLLLLTVTGIWILMNSMAADDEQKAIPVNN